MYFFQHNIGLWKSVNSVEKYKKQVDIKDHIQTIYFMYLTRIIVTKRK